LAVAQNTYAVAWFLGKELNLVFGLQLSIARLVIFSTKSIFNSKKNSKKNNKSRDPQLI
jgi:hypothetical protein